MAENILLLGGTGQAMQLARGIIEQSKLAHQRNHSLTYSIAGLVRQPDLPCTVISGGFTQFGGMAEYMRAQHISLLIDATHPYAAQISQHAARAAVACAIPCWRLERPPWQPVSGDHWLEFDDWCELLPALADYKRVFLSQGRLSQEQLEQLEQVRQVGQQFYLRTAVSSALDLPDWITALTVIGPFTYRDELTLFRELRIDVLVSKNSGGEMTEGKLQAARELGVSVLFLRRPVAAVVGRAFIDTDGVLTALRENCTLRS